MKKISFISIAFCVSTFFTPIMAQTTDVLVNKKGTPILPVAGDWGVGISASPFLEYFGNIFTDAYNPAPVFSSAHPGYLYGKYFLSDNSAIRVNLRIGMSNNTDKSENFTNPDEINKYTESALNLGIAVGIEKYKTIKSRLRGYYGADFVFSKVPNFDGKVTYTDAVNSSNNYVIKGGNLYSIGAQGVIGIEYFFAPKISVSSEFGLVFYGETMGERTYIPENGTSENILDYGGSSFGIRTNTTSLINLFFYF